MKILKSRWLIIVICLILSALIAFVALPGLYDNREATVIALRAAEPIKKGTLIEARHVREVEVGAFGLPREIVTETGSLIGQYALSDIHRDSYFFPDTVGPVREGERLLAALETRQLVTVTVPSMAAGLSSHLQAGDVVSVACFVKEREVETEVLLPDGTADTRMEKSPAQAVVYPELAAVTVFGVENAQTESVDAVREASAEAKETNTRATFDPLPKTVTLEVDAEQALRLIEAEYSGQLHLVLVSRPEGGDSGA